MKNNLQTMLNRFWIWAKTTPEEYAFRTSQEGCKQVKSSLCNGQEPFDGPIFYDLRKQAIQTICATIVSEADLKAFLMVMALDNEDEDLLDFAIDSLSDEMIERIVNMGVNFPQKEARWQVAVLIRRRKPKGWELLLQLLQNDQDEYVRRRAMND